MTPENTEDHRTAPLTVQALKAAGRRKNTTRAAAGAVRHFEEVFYGRLPASAASVEQYIAFCLEQGLAVSTVSQRVALLATWHRELGFPDPTADKGVKAVLKGARALRGRAPKQAEALTYRHLVQLVASLDRAIEQAAQVDDPRASRRLALTAMRDKAFFLTGFWFAFRSDELVRLRFEHLRFGAGEPQRGRPAPRTLAIFLPSSKGDRNAEGQRWTQSELPTLCPVNAMLDWQATRMVDQGPVFVNINRWGAPALEPLHINSVTTMMRGALHRCGMEAEGFSSHSLRRGFAQYAASQGVSIHELMDWVQWKDFRSAARYLESADDLPGRLLAATRHSEAPEKKIMRGITKD